METMQEKSRSRPPTPPPAEITPPATIAPTAGPAIVSEDRTLLDRQRTDTMHAIDVLEKTLRTGLQALAELRQQLNMTVR